MIKISSNDENVQKFINHVHSHLRKNKFKLVLHLDELKIGKNSVSGYFSEEDKEIVISLKESDWLEVLVHEYNHFIQFISNESSYISLTQGDSNYLSEMWEWIDKESEFEEKRLDVMFQTVREMELDCERRTVEMIKQYNLPINLEEYIFTANVYLYFYSFVRKFRCWFKENISIKEMTEFSEMNFSLDDDFSKLPKLYEDVFKKYTEAK